MAVPLHLFAVWLLAPPPIQLATERAPTAADERPGFAVEVHSPASGERLLLGRALAAVALQERESLDPRVDSEALQVTWRGEISLAHAGEWRFEVECSGGIAKARLEDTHAPGGAVEATSVAKNRGSISLSLRTQAPTRCRLTIDFHRDEAQRAHLRTQWSCKREGGGGFELEPIPLESVTPPAAMAEALAHVESVDRGRVLLSELGCIQCHDAGAARSALLDRQLLDLAGVTERADAAWLAAWIAAPDHALQGSAMPACLEESEASDEAGAIVAMLLERDRAAASTPSSNRPPPSTPSALDATAAAERFAYGRELFHSVGCVACHGPLDAPTIAFDDPSLPSEVPATPTDHPLLHLRGKWHAEPLAAFLREPLVVRPHGRMPSLGLSEKEAPAIAHYLTERLGSAPLLPPTSPTAGPDWDSKVARGRELFATRGCARCHTLGAETPIDPAAVAAQPLRALDPLRGCLETTATRRGAAPRYSLSEEQRTSLRAAIAALASVSSADVAPQTAAKAAPAPIDRAALAYAAFRCAACHGSAGERTTPVDTPYFRTRGEADLGDEGRLPPRLELAGERLRAEWVDRVVSDGAVARPYLATRMPRFGSDVAALLVDGMAAAHGRWRTDDRAPRLDGDVAATTPSAERESLAAIGRHLAGSGGLQCIACHSFGTRPSVGTPGLDFTQFAQRLRPEAWRRYALQPARMKPGTRMPRYFEEGKSSATHCLEGDADRQIAALWAWFELAAELPAPEGLPSGDRLLLPIAERPILLRTFLERVGNRAIAVGTPQGLHYAFDADTVRMSEAWNGEFLDVAPVWDGRGGGFARQAGPLAWSAAPGPLLLADDPGAAWPTTNGRPTDRRFLGYRLANDGTPHFLWELRSSDAILVDESIAPDPAPERAFLWRIELTARSERAVRVALRPQQPRESIVRVDNGTLEFPFSKGLGVADLTRPVLVAIDPKRPVVVGLEVRR